MMKYLILAAVASLTTGITLAATQNPTAGCRKWQNLCIPKKYQPVFDRDFSSGHSARSRLGHYVKKIPGTDVLTVPSASFGFLSASVAKVIPSYVVRRGYLHFGIYVTIKPASLAHEERIYPADKVLYNLSGTDVGGDYTHAVVKKMPGLPYYRVNPVFPGTRETEDGWDMVSIDLKNKSKRPPIMPLTWHVASCYNTPENMPASSFTCQRTLVDPNFPYYVSYNVLQPNVHLIPEIDAFIENKIRSWEIKPTTPRSSR